MMSRLAIVTMMVERCLLTQLAIIVDNIIIEVDEYNIDIWIRPIVRRIENVRQDEMIVDERGLILISDDKNIRGI